MVPTVLSYAASLLLIVEALQTHQHYAAFEEYVSAFGRGYQQGSAEYAQRHLLFQQNLDFIETHNAKSDRLWTAGINGLADRTDDELAQLRGYRHVGKRAASARAGTTLLAEASTTLAAPPDEVSWRHLSMAPEVPDQGACGSCWAVATASMLTGRFEAQRNASRSFSMQQLVNCVPNPLSCGGGGGCDGATVELAMEYIEQMGLQHEEAEPYQGKDGTCGQPLPAGSKSSSLLGVTRRGLQGANELGLQNWHKLPSNKALPLMHAVMDGPVAISVGASEWSFYSQGVFNGCSKDSEINHAVTLFGYGKENKHNYWAVRNSWGKSWGEDGFIRLLRHATPQDDDAFCGIDRNPAAGIACKPYPEKEDVCGMCGLLFDSVSAHFGNGGAASNIY